MMYGRGYYGPMMGGGYGFVWFAMACFAFLFLTGLVLAAVWAIRHGAARGGPGGMGMGMGMGMGQHTPAEDTAYNAARERFARGEITAEEFDDIKQRLGY